MAEGVRAPTLEAPVASPPGGGIGAGLEAGPGPMGGGGLGGLTARTEGFGAAPSMPEIKQPEIGEVGIGEVPGAARLAQIVEQKLGTPEAGIREVAGINVPEAGQETKPSGPTPSVEAPPLQPETKAAPPPQGEARPPEASPTIAAPEEKTETPPSPPAEAEKAEAPGGAPVEDQSKTAPQDKKDDQLPEDADKIKRTKELEEKVKNKTATADELKELRGLKQDPEKRRQELEQKALDGTITDQEAEELGKLNAPEDAKNLTPEQQLEKLQKDIDELGTELMKKMANGEEVTQEDLEKLRNLRGQESLINSGFTPDQAKSLGKVAERMRSKWSERQTQAAKEIQSEIQELMALELYLLSIPKTVEQLRQQAKAIKDKADAKHNEAEGAKGQDRVAKKQQEYTLYLQLLEVKSAIAVQKTLPSRIEARRQDLEQAVRRKLGVTHGFRTLVEWGAAKTKNIATEIGSGIEEEKEFAFGRF